MQTRAKQRNHLEEDSTCFECGRIGHRTSLYPPCSYACNHCNTFWVCPPGSSEYEYVFAKEPHEYNFIYRLWKNIKHLFIKQPKDTQ